MMPMISRVALTFAVLAAAGPAWAAAEPDSVRAEIAMAERECRAEGGTPQEKANFAKVADINADGAEDWILDYGKFTCTGSIPSQPFCGSGGCGLQIFLWSGGETWTLAFDEPVQGYRLVKAAGRPAIRIDSAGSACGKVNAETCRRTYRIEGARLMPIR